MSPAAEGYRLRAGFRPGWWRWATSGSGDRGLDRAGRLALHGPSLRCAAARLRRHQGALGCAAVLEGARGRRRPTPAPGTAGMRQIAHGPAHHPLDGGVMGRDARSGSRRKGAFWMGCKKAGGIRAEPRSRKGVQAPGATLQLTCRATRAYSCSCSRNWKRPTGWPGGKALRNWSRTCGSMASPRETFVNASQGTGKRPVTSRSPRF